MFGHSSFATDDPEVAVEVLSEAYADMALTMGDEASFRFALDRSDAGPFQLDEMAIGARARFGFEPEEEFFISRVVEGHLGVAENGWDEDEQFVPGEIAWSGAPGSRSKPTSTPSPRIGSANRMLAALLLATFPNQTAPPPLRRDDHDARRPGTVQRAIAYIESNADLDIGIGDIAAAAEVSRRAIQLAFRRHLDRLPAPGPPRPGPRRTGRRLARGPHRHRGRLPLGILLPEPLRRALSARLRRPAQRDPAPLNASGRGTGGPEERDASYAAEME